MRKLIMLLAVIAVLTFATPAFAERGGDRERPNKPDKDRNVERGRTPQRGQMDPFLVDPSDEMKAELKRHRDVMKELVKETIELKKKIMESIRDEYRKAVEEAKNENPDEEKPAIDREAIIKIVREMYKQEIKALATKYVEENILHSEKMLELKKKDKDRAIEAFGKKLTEVRRGRRPGAGGREGKDGREGRDGGREGRGNPGENRRGPQGPPEGDPR